MERKQATIPLGPLADDLQRARDLYRQVLDMQVWWFLSGQVGGSEGREVEAWVQELRPIQERVGARELEFMFRSVENNMRKELGDRLWHVFQHRTPEQREAAREEIEWRSVDKDQPD